MKGNKAIIKVRNIFHVFRKDINIYIVFAMLTSAFLNISCSEDFSPKAKFQNGYILNCFVQVSFNSGSSNYVTDIKANLSKAYDIDGYIPESVQHDELFRGANIRIYYYPRKNFPVTSFLGDSSVIHLSSPERDTVVKYNYYRVVSGNRDSFTGNEYLELFARMPDGTVLKSELNVPKQWSFEINRAFNHGLTTQGSSYNDGTNLVLRWEDSYNPYYLYFPKMIITGEVSGSGKSLSIEVPSGYVTGNNKSEPIYPGAVRQSYISFTYAAIDSAMKNISKGYEDKSKIRILSCRISVTAFERNLASYYSSTHGYMDSYSVRTDENIYSNIQGGLGIFGASVNYSENISIDKTYAKSFGYITIYE